MDEIQGAREIISLFEGIFRKKKQLAVTYASYVVLPDCQNEIKEKSIICFVSFMPCVLADNE